jgi:hypothetical protein
MSQQSRNSSCSRPYYLLLIVIELLSFQHSAAIRNNATIGALTFDGFWPGFFTDWGVGLRFLIANWYPVTSFDTILPSALIQTSPNSDKYFRIGKCARPDVLKCLKHGKYDIFYILQLPYLPLVSFITIIDGKRYILLKSLCFLLYHRQF